MLLMLEYRTVLSGYFCGPGPDRAPLSHPDNQWPLSGRHGRILLQLSVWEKCGDGSLGVFFFFFFFFLHLRVERRQADSLRYVHSRAGSSIRSYHTEWIHTITHTHTHTHTNICIPPHPHTHTNTHTHTRTRTHADTDTQTRTHTHRHIHTHSCTAHTQKHDHTHTHTHTHALTHSLTLQHVLLILQPTARPRWRSLTTAALHQRRIRRDPERAQSASRSHGRVQRHGHLLRGRPLPRHHHRHLQHLPRLRRQVWGGSGVVTGSWAVTRLLQPECLQKTCVKQQNAMMFYSSVNRCTPLGQPQSIFRPIQLVLCWRISKVPKQKLMQQKYRT